MDITGKVQNLPGQLLLECLDFGVDFKSRTLIPNPEYGDDQRGGDMDLGSSELEFIRYLSVGVAFLQQA